MTIFQTLKQHSEPDKVDIYPRFFKTGPGEYGEGDKFLGVRVPNIRKVAKRYWKETSLEEATQLLYNEYHEVRMCALFILTHHFDKGDSKTKSKIVDIYLSNLEYVNNWDLVDCSAHKILGRWLLDKKDRSILYRLAKTGHLWSQRVAIISTMAFADKGELDDLYAISDILLEHEHDLIHKAVGWLLRIAGDTDRKRLISYINNNYARFPRTALRYAIEKLPETQRKAILVGNG